MFYPNHYVNKELSWLSFNERVLQEAADRSVPLIERIKFLGIFSSNLDEFYRVRVATLKRLAGLGKKAKKFIGSDPAQVLKELDATVLKQHKRFDTIYQDALKDLAKEHIHIIDETQLNAAQSEFVRTYFRQEVRPKLIPVMVDQLENFPELKDQSIYLLIHLSKNDCSDDPVCALIEVPTDVLPRFIVLPRENRNWYIILLDDVIRYGLEDIFSTFAYEVCGAYTIKLTRDAELDIDDDLSESYIRKVSKSLKQRKEGTPVRFIYDERLPKPILKSVSKRLKLVGYDTKIPGGKYHNFKDFMAFPDLGLKKLRYPPLPPLPHPAIDESASLFNVIKERDILLHFPYQSFHPVIDLLREAAIDPHVKSIKVTVYRVARNSAVMNALINAAKNGKAVTAVLELQARFDEEANIDWANRLQEEGIRVIYGVPGLKVHSKLCLITRQEGQKTTRFAIIGTGNLNEITAKIYSDHSLFTADKRLTSEAAKVFEFFEQNYNITDFKHLIVSPFQMRKKFDRFIRKETKNASEGKEAYIILKLNNLVDPQMIERLYKASQAGVKIKLFVRGMFSPVPGIKNLSENIEGVCIVDRFLEHSRIAVFCNGGDEKYFITSADLMPRNLDRRVEVTCPIYDKALQHELRTFLEIQNRDNVKARHRVGKLEQNKMPSENPRVRSQLALYDFFKTAHLERLRHKADQATNREQAESVQPTCSKS